MPASDGQEADDLGDGGVMVGTLDAVIEPGVEADRAVGQGRAVAAGRLRVVDARGRALLGFVSEGGDFLDRVVVSNAADRLVVDARAAFAAGMKKLVVSSHDIGPADYAGGDLHLSAASPAGAVVDAG